MKFCPECGNKVNGGNFCSNCGAPLSNTSNISDMPNIPNDGDISIDDAIKNVMELADEERKENETLRVKIIRGQYAEAKEYCDRLLKKEPLDRRGYIGFIRIASKNYKIYEGFELTEAIRVAEEVFGGINVLLSDAEFSEYMKAREEFFDNRERERLRAKAEAEERERLRREEIERRNRETEENDRIQREKRELSEAENAERVRRFEEKRRILQDAGFIVDGDFTLIKYTGTGGRVEIPEEICAIADNAFQGAELLSEVIVRGNLKRVGNNAFCGCSTLGSIEFKGDTGDLGFGVFQNCGELERAVLPRNLKAIPQHMFFNCVRLRQVYGADEAETIGNFAFYDCGKLISVEFGNLLKHIGNSAFKGCLSLPTIRLGENLKSIGEDGFGGCRRLSDIKLADGVSAIGKGCFKGCGSLESIHIPRGVAIIQVGTFAGCVSLKCVKTEDTLLEIKGSAFAGCVNLSDIEIGGNVLRIHAAAFNDCKSVRISAENKKYKSIGNCIIERRGDRSAVIGSMQGAVVVFGIEEIGDYAFSNRRMGAAKLVLPPSVDRVGVKAFADSAIEELIIYSENISFQENAFGGTLPRLKIRCKPSVQAKLKNNPQYGLSVLCEITEIK